jgi:hypothetical protein
MSSILRGDIEESRSAASNVAKPVADHLPIRAGGHWGRFCRRGLPADGLRVVSLSCGLTHTHVPAGGFSASTDLTGSSYPIA